jgi:uncharacterized protein YbjQ (UPF0145 family)
VIRLRGATMKRFFGSVIAVLLLLTAAPPATARDDKLMFSIAAALEAPAAKEKLDPSIKYFFGDQPHPRILTKLRTDTTSQKTNSVNKTDEAACKWVFLSAMLQLQRRAQQIGANAVVRIVSNYNHVEMSSPTEFECHAGTIMAGVALKGDFVKIEAR